MNQIKNRKKNTTATAISIASAATLGAILQSETTAQEAGNYKTIQGLDYEIVDGNLIVQTPEGSILFDSTQYFIESGNVFLTENAFSIIEATFATTGAAATAVAGGINGSVVLGGLALLGGAAALANKDDDNSTPVATNSIPTVTNELPDVNATAGSGFTLDIPSSTFSDADNDTLSFSATTSSGETLPDWLSFDAEANTISGTPPETFSGDVEVNITANDGNGGTVTDTFTLEVAPRSNTAPVASNIENQTINAEQALDFTIPAFTDSDGDTLTYSALLADGSPIPEWLILDTATGKFTGTPPASAVGDMTIVVTANDGFNGSASSEFTFTINARPNTAPVINTEISDTEGKVGTDINFTLPANTFTDNEGDSLTYSATLANGDALPAWMSIDDQTGNITGTPPSDSQGVYEIKITATDDRDASTTSEAFQISVFAIPVVASAIDDDNGTVGDAYSFTLPADTFTDADTDTLTYSASLEDGSDLPDWMSFDSATGNISGTPSTGDNGSFNITITATDDKGSTASDTFALVINAPPVVATEISDQAATVASAYNFTLPTGTFTDADNENLTYSIGSSTLPAGLSFDTATGNITGTPAIGSQGSYDITISATDGKGATTSDTFEITVAVPPSPQITNASNTTSFAETDAASAELTVTGENVVSWSIEGADASLFTIDENGKIKFTGDAASSVDFENQTDTNGDGTYQITVKGVNGIGEATTKDFTFVVTDVTELPDFITTSTYGGDNEGVQSLLSLDGEANYSHWEGNGSTNTATELTYSFQTIGTSILTAGGNITLTQNFNTAGQQFIADVFQNFSSVANITFTETDSQAAVQDGGADIRIAQGTSTQLGVESTTLGYAYLPSGSNPKSIDLFGNMFIVSDTLDSNSFTTAYSDELNTISHELGHAMGLDHPFNSTGGENAGFFPYEDTDHLETNTGGEQTGGGHDTPLTDSMLETIMTYHNPYSPFGADGVTPWELGIYDIAALQHLYGANYDTNAGDTVYSYDSETPIFEVIWDGGGTDTIVHSGNNASIINLNEGQTSHLGMTPNWSVTFTSEDLGYAAGSIIQSASLSEESDGTVTISADGTSVTITSNLELGGTDQEVLLNTQAEGYQPGTNTYTLDRGYVNEYTSSNVGIAFGVTIENGIGGNGNDTIIGNSAYNMLTGNGGNDTLTGAGGNDIFIYDNGSSSVSTNEFGNDSITDFTSGNDVIHIQSEIGSDNVSFSDGVLTLGTAGTITLTDVTSLTEGTDYIFV